MDFHNLDIRKYRAWALSEMRILIIIFVFGVCGVVGTLAAVVGKVPQTDADKLLVVFFFFLSVAVTIAGAFGALYVAVRSRVVTYIAKARQRKKAVK